MWRVKGFCLLQRHVFELKEPQIITIFIMSRKLDEKTMTKLKKGGVWEKIMKEVIKDPNLSPEIREGKLKVYYQKGLVMTLDGKKDVPEILAPGYYKGHSTINIDPTHPKDYFKWAKEMVGNYSSFNCGYCIRWSLSYI